MTKQEMDKIIAVAVQGQHGAFEYIKSYNELRAVKFLKNIYKKLVRTCKKSSKIAVKDYKKCIATTQDTIELITWISKMDICIEFYSKEIDTMCDMLDEFRSYLWSGHFLDIYLFNRTREEKDMIDMRGIVHESDTKSDNEGC